MKILSKIKGWHCQVLVGLLILLIVGIHVFPVNLTSSKIEDNEIVGTWRHTESSLLLLSDELQITPKKAHIIFLEDGKYVQHFDYGDIKYNRFKKGEWTFISREWLFLHKNWLKLDAPYDEDNSLWDRPDFFFVKEKGKMKMYMQLSDEIDLYEFEKE